VIPRLLAGAAAVALLAASVIWLDASRVQKRGSETAFAPRGAAGTAVIEGAISDLGRMRRLAPDAPSYLLEAFLLSRAGRRAETVRTLERVVRQEPENLEAWLFLAKAETDRRRSREAYRRARELNPGLYGGRRLR
jgi:cytochrome c-type biogenesis protein CcmH/NrfG